MGGAEEREYTLISVVDLFIHPCLSYAVDLAVKIGEMEGASVH